MQQVSALNVTFVFTTKHNRNMSKSTHFFGQPVYGQLIKSLDKEKIIEMSRKHGGEKYVKSFDGWHHLQIGRAHV